MGHGTSRLWGDTVATVAGRSPGIEELPRKEGRGWRFYALIVAGVLLAVFVIQNSQSVEVEFLFSTVDTPLIFALLIAGGLGGIIGWAWPHVRRGRKAERKLEEDG
jgi:uncharacterized integral membrane protein